MFGAVNTLRRVCVAVSHELVGGQSWPPMQSCEVQIAARPSDESFRLLVLDPDAKIHAKIHTFVCFVAQLARVGQLGWILQALGFLFEQLGIGQLGIETWKLISSGSWGWLFEQHGVGRLGKLGCQILLGLQRVPLSSSLGNLDVRFFRESYGWFVEQLGVGHLGSLGVRFFTGSWG